MAEPDDIECEGTDEVVCPYCGYEFEASWEFFQDHSNTTDIECMGCDKTFECEQEVVVSYTTSKKEKTDGP